MKDANIPGEVGMVQAGAPQVESSQDDMTLPMLNTKVEGSSSDAGVPSASKKQQASPPPEVVDRAASDDLPSQHPEVCYFYVLCVSSCRIHPSRSVIETSASTGR